MTPIVLVLSALVFCILLSCLFYTCPAADGASQNQVVGIYFMNASQTAKHHLTPSLLGTFTLVIIATTFVIAMIPARKKLK